MNKEALCILLTIATAIVFFVTTANAQIQPRQSQCNDRAIVLEVLQKNYKEEPIALGVTTTGGLIELLTSPDDTTWTIIVTTPRGMSCLVAAGNNWKKLNRRPLGEGV